MRLVEVEPVALLEDFLPAGALYHLLDRRRQRRQVLVLDAGWGEDGAPVDQLDIYPLLLERRHVDAGDALRGGDADRPQLAGRHLRRELLPAADADGGMAAENRAQRLAAAA